MNSQEEQKQTELKRPTPLSNYPDNSNEKSSELKRSFVGQPNNKHNFVYKDPKEYEGVPVTTIQINKDRDTSTGGSRKF